MNEYWESRFKKEGAMWKFEASDSAYFAMDLFKKNKLNKILIPGFGYGRNAKLFYENGFDLSGIEISESAIKLAKENGIDCTVHCGSVTQMPFDKDQFDGIFCYALIHLLNKKERRDFLKACFSQLKPGGLMIFTVVSEKANMFGKGRKVSNNRYEVGKGLNVYFYNHDTVINEFRDYGKVTFRDIEEPIKFMTGEEPLKCIFVVCRKN